jgi:hypothetical protein
MTVITDPELRISAKYCDRPFRTPFSVLLDANGTVSLVQDGRSTGEFSLANAVDAVLSDRPYDMKAAYLGRTAYGRHAPDGELLASGRWVRLSQLWRGRPLLLTFFLAGCSSCEDRLRLLERALGNSRAVSRVYVYPNRAEAETAARTLRTRALVAADETGAVHTSYQVWHAPTTFLIRNGRVVYAPDDRSNPNSLERLLRFNLLPRVPALVARASTTTRR